MRRVSSMRRVPEMRRQPDGASSQRRRLLSSRWGVPSSMVIPLNDGASPQGWFMPSMAGAHRMTLPLNARRSPTVCSPTVCADRQCAPSSARASDSSARSSSRSRDASLDSARSASTSPPSLSDSWRASSASRLLRSPAVCWRSGWTSALVSKMAGDRSRTDPVGWTGPVEEGSGKWTRPVENPAPLLVRPAPRCVKLGCEWRASSAPSRSVGPLN